MIRDGEVPLQHHIVCRCSDIVIATRLHFFQIGQGVGLGIIRHRFLFRRIDPHVHLDRCGAGIDLDLQPIIFLLRFRLRVSGRLRVNRRGRLRLSHGLRIGGRFRLSHGLGIGGRFSRRLRLRIGGRFSHGFRLSRGLGIGGRLRLSRRLRFRLSHGLGIGGRLRLSRRLRFRLSHGLGIGGRLRVSRRGRFRIGLDGLRLLRRRRLPALACSGHGFRGGLLPAVALRRPGKGGRKQGEHHDQGHHQGYESLGTHGEPPQIQ